MFYAGNMEKTRNSDTKSEKIKSYVKTYGFEKAACASFLDKARLDTEIFGKKADNNKLYSKSIEISSYGLCSLRDDRGYYTALEKGNMLKGFRGVSLQRRNVLRAHDVG